MVTLEIECLRAAIRAFESGSIRSFLLASEEVCFESQSRQQLYARIEQLLVQQQYRAQSKAERGLLRRYIEKMTA